MMSWNGDGASWWAYLLMTISMVVFWGLVVAGVVALVRYIGGSAQQAGPSQPIPPTPERVLADRLARGEIDEDEYRRRLDTLRASEHRLVRSSAPTFQADGTDSKKPDPGDG